MARFAAGARRLVVRACTIGGLLAVGWLLAVVFGLFSASPAAADSTAVPGVSNAVAASDNAAAMAGREVDGLTSQSKPALPAPSTVDLSSGSHGFVPQGGGGSGLGPGMGDVARSYADPRLTALRAPLACVLPPVVRTAADDPSFSPD
jgi:hypothetical protein